MLSGHPAPRLEPRRTTRSVWGRIRFAIFGLKPHTTAIWSRESHPTGYKKDQGHVRHPYRALARYIMEIYTEPSEVMRR